MNPGWQEVRSTYRARLRVSWATLKRDLNYLKDRLNFVLIAKLGGYRFETDERMGRGMTPGNTVRGGHAL